MDGHEKTRCSCVRLAFSCLKSQDWILQSLGEHSSYDSLQATGQLAGTKGLMFLKKEWLVFIKD